MRLLTILILILSFNLFSQDFESNLDNYKLKNPEGQEFWICFMRNHNDPDRVTENTRLYLELFITSDKDANIVVEIKSLNFREEVFVPANTVRNIKLNPQAQITSSEIIEEGMAVHVKSDTPVTVYGLNRRRLTTDTFLGLPTTVIGKMYRAICYNISVQLTSQFAIVATEDNTKVTIVPSVETSSGRAANKPFDIILNQGDVYQITARNKPNDPDKNDLSGSLISADKNISFFSGHQCAYIPDNVMACNHLVEQMPPTPSWGKHYYIGELKKRSKYNYRILANEDSTKIFVNNKYLTTLNAGKYIEQNVSGEIQVTASNPILVTQYSQGFRNGDAIGDPMMLLISPTQQFLKKYRFATPVNGFWEHYVNVVVPTKAISSLKLNGKPVPTNIFRQFGKTRYSIAYLRVNYGTHQLEADEPFGMTPYGFGYDKDKYDAYGNLGGQSFLEFVNYKDTIAPDAIILNKELILRDDRVNDEGLDKFEVLYSENLELDQYNFEAGVPQVSLKLRVIEVQKYGKLRFRVFDVAGNSQDYTLCWHLDLNASGYVNDITDGDISCGTSFKISYQIFGGISNINSNAEAKQLAGISSKGDYHSSNSWSHLFGVGISMPIYNKLNFNSRLALTKVNTILESPDSTTSKLLLGDGTFVNMQEATQINFNKYQVNLQLNIEYNINANLYCYAGIIPMFFFTKTIEHNRKIVYPSFANYPETSDKLTNKVDKELKELNQFNFGLNFGVGYNLNLMSNISAFANLEYNYNSMSYLQSPNSLKLNMLNFYIGVKYFN